MFKFDKDKKLLKICKVDVPDLGINIMGDLQQSYRMYLEKTIYEDMEYLNELLHTYQDMIDLELKVTVKGLECQTYAKTQTQQGKYYYPVIGTFYLHGNPVGRDMELLRIPFMDDYGKINVDGSSKVVVSVQRASEDISYNLKNNMFNIAMPYANVRIYAGKKSVKMSYGKYRFPIEEIISAMLYEAGDSSKVIDIFRNTYLLNSMKLSEKTLNMWVYNQFNTRTDLLKKLKSVQYKLGKTREALNTTLSLDRAVGEVLSRDTLTYKEGDLITQSMVKDFKRNRIPTVYVQNKEVIAGYTLAIQAPILVTEVPAGTKNCTLLRKRIPQFANEAIIPEDVVLGRDNMIVIDNASPLTKEVAEFLLIIGYKELDVYPGNSKTAIKYSFEREICSNYTARLGELTTQIPDGRSADEWVYYYNNPTLERTNMEHLTVHDLIAIVSIIGQIMLTGVSPLLNRDNSFLKKTLLINEIFSETLRKTMQKFVQTYHATIQSNGTNSTGNNPFYSLTNKWISFMNKERFLAPADTINLAAEVSQACHVTTLMPSSAEVVDEMRHLAMPFYGRICPYETPAGKKLGLVNTKAIGARMKDNMLMAPYRKVIATANGIRISDNITWLSVKDELGSKFGDILSLKTDGAGNYLNTPVLARIPNPDVSDEPFIFATINAFELAGGYVSAYPEQFLSPTAMLIPFACSDDPVRVSYGLSQIRQAIYLPNSQRPYVRTSMYEDIFSYSETNKYIAPCTGTVTMINNMRAEIVDTGGNIHTVYMQGFGHQGHVDVTMEIHVTVGAKVREGQCIAEAHKYPQPFVVRAPYSGTVISISDSMIQIAKSNVNVNSFVDLENVDGIAINNGRIMGQSAIFLNLHVSVGDYVEKGQILADTCMSRGGVYSPARNPLVAYIMVGYNYEDGICATQKAATDYTSLIAHSIDKKINKKHYRYARAASLNGFDYCGPSDVVGTIKLKDNIDDNDSHNTKVRATLKANGIPYEVKTLEDDMLSRTYRYHLLGFNRLQAGDKMAGRHGNKGVVSMVLPDSKAPQLMNGRTIEFMLNPCGVPSRMNLGQIDDCHLGLVVNILGVEIDSPPFNGASMEEIEYLLRYAWTLAHTEAIGDNVTKTYNKGLFDSVARSFSELPNEFHELVWENIENIIDWRGAFNPDGTATVYDPETDTFYENPICIGYPTFFKLMQEADEKLNVRAGLLEEQYARTTSQPQKGDYSAKGQRMAEMELMALAAMGSASFIDEIINEKSDNTGKQVNVHLKQLGINNRVNSSSCTARAVENLLYLLEGVGVKTEVPLDIADTSYHASKEKYKLDVRSIVQHAFGSITDTQERVTNTDTVDSFSDVMD